MKTFLYNNWLRILAIVMLVGAAADLFINSFTLPYAFYQLMCWIVVVASLIIVWKSKNAGNQVHLWIFALVAVIFNPLSPIYFNTLGWQIADVVVALLFIVSFFTCKEMTFLKKIKHFIFKLLKRNK